MGNTPSNRRITVENDEVTGVIKISDSVVRRLKGELEYGREKRTQPPVQSTTIKAPSNDAKPPSQPVENTDPTTMIPPEVTSPVETPTPKVVPVTVEVPPAIQHPTVDLVKGPYPYENFMEEAHLTAMKLRDEKEAEIHRVEEHWRKQLLNLTNHYNQLAQLNEAEYQAAVKDVEHYYAKETVGGVCTDEKDCVLKCYRENKDQPLKCSNEVKKFASCVQQFRLNNLGKST